MSAVSLVPRLPAAPRPAAPPLVSNPLGVYGPIERMRIGSSLIKKRPVEVEACKRIFTPNAPEFIPAPPRPDRYTIHCYVCGEYKWPEEFHRAKHNTWRLGRFTICKACRKAGRTVSTRWSAALT